jgi:thiol:disulfide interchange protein
LRPLIAIKKKLARMRGWLVVTLGRSVALAAALLLALPVLAVERTAQTENVTIALTPESETAAPDRVLWAAVSMRIREGWHTYWLNPGDSGLPLSLTWRLPEGWTAGEIVWPAPQRFPIGPLVNFGYQGEAHFLIPLFVPKDAALGEMHLELRADWLVCEEICIPETADLAFKISVLSDEPTIEPSVARLFAQARQAIPQPSPYPAVLEFDGQAARLRLMAPDLAQAGVRSAFFFPEDERVAKASAAQTLRTTPAEIALLLTPERTLVAQGVVKGILRLQLEGGSASAPLSRDYAVEATISITQGSDQGGETRDLALPLALAFAFLGGMILNLMPCVFPVLSLKIMALIQHGAGRTGRHGLAYMAGVGLCFLAIASVLLGLRVAGEAVGWGFQMQNPIMVALLAHVFLVLGLSMSGVFDVQNVGFGQALAARRGLAGSFFTGALAALAATPCTAPFMGAALGYALAQPPLPALSVFVVLGLGMAFPFLVLSFSPSLLRRLPRPGAWMEGLKQALAFPLYASAAWLVWVLVLQAGEAALAYVLASMLGLAFAAWFYGATRQTLPWRARFGTAFFAMALLATPWFAWRNLHDGQEEVPQAQERDVDIVVAQIQGEGTMPYSEALLKALRLEGRPVLVNFTAAWCVTCLVNERVAFADPTVQEALRAGGVALLKADWTKRNPAITETLTRHGRSGVPLYLLYRPGIHDPVVLPQILTPRLVLDALTALPKDRADTARP